MFLATHLTLLTDDAETHVMPLAVVCCWLCCWVGWKGGVFWMLLCKPLSEGSLWTGLFGQMELRLPAHQLSFSQAHLKAQPPQKFNSNCKELFHLK